MKLGLKSVKNLVGFLGDLKTPKFHSEINWLTFRHLILKHMTAYSDCLWRGNVFLIYCDLLWKSWFPYYKHALILLTLRYIFSIQMKESSFIVSNVLHMLIYRSKNIRCLGFQDYFSLYCPKSCPNPSATSSQQIKEVWDHPPRFFQSLFCGTQTKGGYGFH